MLSQYTDADLARFWSKVDTSSDCWLWTGSQLPKGYGLFSLGRRSRFYAHRFAFSLRYGPLPGNQNVCHVCDTPGCVRNDGALRTYEIGGVALPCYGHLFLGTTLQNF